MSINKPVSIEQVEAVVKACNAQHEQLMFMEQHLPTHLPGNTATHLSMSSVAPAASHADEAERTSFGDENAPSNPRSRPSSADLPGEKKKRAPAPRRYG